uniref:Cadherin domain-containing protein n=1 Tax=Cairina moschata TaxID=8855 RepID=A0A8C3BYE9_CAIMO
SWKEGEPLPGRALFVILLLCVSGGSAETARYSVPEEAARGSLVGNIAKDLGLTAEELSTRQVRLVPEGEKQYFQLDQHTGDLFVREQMDGEEMCGQSEPCLVRFDVLLEGPLQSFRAEVSLTDINDHAPVFLNKEIILKISETTKPKARFLLESAQDPDVGNNSVHHYNISSNGYFHIYIRQRSDGRRHAELVLDRELDREKQAEVVFSITAVDGGSPPRSGTAVICVVVLDANDNIPVFTQSLYKVRVLENASAGSVVLRVVATDPDLGVNGDISYRFSQSVGENQLPFTIDTMSGAISVTKPLDFETTQKYDLSAQAIDGGGLSGMCNIVVEVMDVNDNAPEVVVSSFSSPLPENTEPGTLVALFAVRDRDSGVNGEIICALEDQLSFSLRPAYKNYYELVTVSTLDREETAQYLAVMTAADTGSPPLTTTQTFTVDISDVNDNAPVFNQTSYTMYVRENNIPGVLVGAVSAVDSDAGANAKVTYSLRPVHPTERDPCSCISVNSENGHVFVLRPLDYEQVRQLEVLVSATDAGSPPLSTNVTIRLLVVDENDNAPLVLHPAQDSSLPSSELVPALAEVGDLVTKVVAVDADSGQNSWLSFHLLRATDPGLFAVGSQNGEVRLRRPVTERDAVKQKLEVLVRDNGRPPLSATAALSVLLLNSLSQEHLRQQELAVQDEDSSLTIYLIISLVFVSLLFLTSVAAFVACKVCKRKELKGGDMPYGTGNLQSSVADGAAAGTLPHAYCYEINLTTGSGNSEFKFLKPILPSVPPQHSGIRKIDFKKEYPFFLCHCFHSCLKVFLNEREVLSWSGFPGFC